MKLTVKTLNMISISCLVAGVVIAYLKFFFHLNWFDSVGDMNVQMLIGNIVIFIGLIFRGYYRMKKYGKWF